MLQHHEHLREGSGEYHCDRLGLPRELDESHPMELGCGR
jgi:hypothetical protein